MKGVVERMQRSSARDLYVPLVEVKSSDSAGELKVKVKEREREEREEREREERKR